MDRKTARSRKDKVLRRFARLITPLGFSRTKPTFFTRRRSCVVEFIHAHKFSFTESFRVHLGIRVLADDRDHVHLNGLVSSEWQSRGAPGGRRFDFTFHGEESHVDKAARELAAFAEVVAEPWFAKWSANDALLGEGSPLLDEEQAWLRRAASGEPLSEAATASVLGVAPMENA